MAGFSRRPFTQFFAEQCCGFAWLALLCLGQNTAVCDEPPVACGLA